MNLSQRERMLNELADRRTELVFDILDSGCPVDGQGPDDV